MRGMDYLVGVRFQASGNLYEAMGKLSMSMLAADEGVKLLKNRFAAMAAAGVSMFAALTDASVQYTNSVAQLAVTLNGVKNLHKNLGFVYGTTGQAAYLTPGTRAGIVSSTAPLFYGQHPKGANREFAGLVSTAHFGLQMKSAAATSLVSSLMSAGVFYAEDMGHRKVSTQEHIAANVTKQIIGHMDMVLPSQRGTYLATAEKVFSSPLISKLGAQMTPAMLAPVIGALVRANAPGGAQGVINLLAGKGMTNTGALEALMAQQFHFGIGTRNNVLAAASGNFLYLKAHGVANPYTYMAHMGLFGLERMAGFKNYVSPGKMTTAERQKFVSEAELMFGNRNAAMRDLVIAKLREPKGFMATPSNYAAIQAAAAQRTTKSLDYLAASLDTFTGVLGKYVETAPIIHAVGRGIYGADAWYASHTGALRGAAGAGVAGSLSFMGAGVMGALAKISGIGGGRIFSTLFDVLGKLFAALGSFQTGYSIGSLLRAIPLVRAVGDWIGKKIYDVGKISNQLQYLFRAIADFLEMIGTWKHPLSSTSRIGADLLKSASSSSMFRLVTSWLGSSGGHPAAGAPGSPASVAFNGFLKTMMHGHPYTVAWGAHEAYFNKNKDMEQWDVAYTNPITGKAAVNTVNIHFHGANPNSKSGLEDIKRAVTDGLKRATTAAGFETATPFAIGK